MKLLMVDTETGGLDPAIHSLFSVAMVIWEDGEIKDSLHITVKEPNGVVTAEAIKINGFTKERIDKGLTPNQTVFKITEFCKKNGIAWNAEIGGHNVAFDAGFLQRLYKLAGKKYPFSHRMICTQSAALILRLAGKFDVKSTKLDDLCEKYGIVIRMEGQPTHDALEDITATAHLLTKLLKEITG